MYLCHAYDDMNRLLHMCNMTRLYTAAHCNTLQRTATHCNTLQHTATHRSYAWQESPPSYAQHDSFIRIPWLIHICDVTHPYMRDSPLTQVQHHYVLRCNMTTLIERTPPHKGGFLFTMFRHQEPCVRGPPIGCLMFIGHLPDLYVYRSFSAKEPYT